jgi:cytochrome c oxidase subunit 3
MGKKNKRRNKMADHSNNGHEAYYVPESSPLAFLASISLFLTLFGAASMINDLSWGDPNVATNSKALFTVGLISFTAVLFWWFRTTIVENMAGMNSAQLKRSYVIGMQWFIFSEVMFFFVLFGTLWYVRNLVGPWLAGEGEGGRMNGLIWPGFEYNWPMNTTPQDAVGIANQPLANNGTFSGATGTVAWTHIPLWNTILLLSSSVTLHFAHHALKEDHRSKFNIWLGITLILGFVFVYFQGVEYQEAYNDLGLTLGAGIYGTTFFFLTGFHGFHVCMGALMLTVQWLRSMQKNHFSKDDHFGFEASAWYWHFVDVVWIFLMLFVYIL